MDVSAEFYKKLNQQLITKDNLIKLLKTENESLKKQVRELSENAPVREEYINRISVLESELSRKDSQISELKFEVEKNLTTQMKRKSEATDRK